ncbi:DNA-3-methyladenine glycosylase 2 family protein [Actinomadura barringtoniae]|uniref:DNA-3-methyladenine glycosylase II n=1 Tax=Actinomadura barringtoniae TaxID=1427535 RepID=A0A939PCF8_9ACTN|nr:DNA-3-methyladenine glycosylase 2 family protein [Actinomadura barringtoniae]MBO2450282.1 DNA-3-methyladenine glycosylase 2 family protein [Actinomadura barringtoniae]
MTGSLVRAAGEPDWSEGRERLRAVGGGMRRLVEADPELDPAEAFDGWGDGLWTSLLRQVTDQHISNASAMAIIGRLRERCGGRLPDADEFLALAGATLTEVGYSRAKIATLTEVARRVVHGRLDAGRLAGLGDDAVRAELTEIKGVGRFTADGALILALGRTDVMPSADLQIRKALAELGRWDELPSVRAVDDHAERWAPWRTLAAAYLYATL